MPQAKHVLMLMRPRPMAPNAGLTRVTAAMVLTVALAGCGGGGDGAGTSDDRARTVVAPATAAPDTVRGVDKALTESQLRSALLTVADLPTGYKAIASSEDDSSGTQGNDEGCSAKFERLGGNDDNAAAHVEATFQGAGLGTVLEQGLESYDDEDELRGYFDEVVSVLSDCPSFSTTDEKGIKTDFSVGALSFPKLGDDTVALAVTGKTPDFNLALNVVIVRLGRNVMSVSQGGLTADVAALEQAARRGFEKLEAAN